MTLDKGIKEPPRLESHALIGGERTPVTQKCPGLCYNRKLFPALLSPPLGIKDSGKLLETKGEAKMVMDQSTEMLHF